MRLNSSKQGWASCEGCDYSGNVFLNNSKRFGLSTRFQNGSTIQLYDDEAINPPADPMRGGKRCIAKADYTDAQFSDFPRHEQLEFKALGGAIDTTKIGLRCDEFRRSLPPKAAYRAWAREFFAGVPSHTPICSPGTEAPGCPSLYTAAAATKIASMESGAKLLGMTEPCPPMAKTDCVGELLPWGQCQADGEMVFRFTVEVEAALGGAPCAREDGEAVSLAC